jgi:hypothetical protein
MIEFINYLILDYKGGMNGNKKIAFITSRPRKSLERIAIIVEF